MSCTPLASHNSAPSPASGLRGGARERWAWNTDRDHPGRAVTAYYDAAAASLSIRIQASDEALSQARRQEQISSPSPTGGSRIQAAVAAPTDPGRRAFDGSGRRRVCLAGSVSASPSLAQHRDDSCANERGSSILLLRISARRG